MLNDAEFREKIIELVNGRPKLKVVLPSTEMQQEESLANTQNPFKRKSL